MGEDHWLVDGTMIPFSNKEEISFLTSSSFFGEIVYGIDQMGNASSVLNDVRSPSSVQLILEVALCSFQNLLQLCFLRLHQLITDKDGLRRQFVWVFCHHHDEKDPAVGLVVGFDSIYVNHEPLCISSSFDPVTLVPR